MKMAKSYSLPALLIILISTFSGLPDSWRFFLIVLISLFIIYISIEWPKGNARRGVGKGKRAHALPVPPFPGAASREGEVSNGAVAQPSDTESFHAENDSLKE